MSGPFGGSFAAFLDMGGHALYVWLSYGSAVAVVLYNEITVRRRERRFFREQRARQQRARTHRQAVAEAAGDRVERSHQA